MANKRLYTEKEISTILKRAGERQAEQGEKEAQGLSLEEIQQIAGEVGLDPAIVAAVAAEMESNLGSVKGLSKFGLPAKVEVERVLPGRVTEDEWPEIVAAIESELGVVGASGQVGKMLEWTYTSRFAQYKVSFTPGEDQSRVRIFGNFSRLARIWLLPLMIFCTMQAGLIPLSTGASLLASGAIALSVAMLVYFLIRFGFVTYLNGKEGSFERLIGRMSNTVAMDNIEKKESQSGQVDQPDVESMDRDEEGVRTNKKVRESNQ